MKRIVNAVLIAVNSLLLIALVSSASNAHQASTFYDNRWPINANVTWHDDFSLSQNFPAMFFHAAERWDNRVSGRGPHFIKGDRRQMDNPLSPCAGPNGVFMANLEAHGFPAGVLGFTPQCDPGPDGIVTGFTMAINSQVNWSLDDNIGPNQVDLASVLSHEWGHATGWSGHYGEGSEHCPVSPQRETMCPGWTRDAPLAMRTLEEHDLHTLRNAYN